MKPSVPLLVLAAGATLAHADESMRCGKWVVNSDLPTAELLSKCGEPSSKDSTTDDIRAKHASGRGTFVVGQTTTERWYYERGPGALRMVVTVVDGKIKSIDRAE
jgi:hypothetical protein